MVGSLERIMKEDGKYGSDGIIVLTIALMQVGNGCRMKVKNQEYKHYKLVT